MGELSDFFWTRHSKVVKVTQSILGQSLALYSQKSALLEVLLLYIWKQRVVKLPSMLFMTN